MSLLSSKARTSRHPSSATTTLSRHDSRSAWSEEAPTKYSSSLRLSDEALRTRALEVSSTIDFQHLTNLSACNWKWMSTRKRFTVFSRAVDASTAGPGYEVLTAGEMRCSPNELQNILGSAYESDYNAAMKGIYKKQFIYGSIVRTAYSASTKSVSDAESSVYESDRAERLLVKTATFVRSSPFGHNEQWCFFENYKPHTEDNGFSVIMGSMNESDLTVGKVTQRRVNQMHDITAAYSVEPVPDTKQVRILFHAHYTGDNASADGNASTRAIKARMQRLGKGVSKLQDIVHRRRFGNQVPANRSAFEAKNSHCIACTKPLTLLVKKIRCYLCGYYVCDGCIQVEQIESGNGRVSTCRVCRRCGECVQACEYSNVDPNAIGDVSIKPDRPDRQSSAKAMTDMLYDAISSASSDRKKSVISVVKEMIAADNADSNSPSVSPVVLNADKEEEECLSMLKNVQMDKTIPLENCVLANAKARDYPITLADDPANKVPDFPLPKTEDERAKAVKSGGYKELMDCYELDILCSIAAQQLNCMISFVTIIDEDEQVTIASSSPDMQKITIPRCDAFCSHTIMDSKPLLVPHPESDMRFHNLGALISFNIKFYFGIPLMTPDGHTIGSICCLDSKSHDVDQTQYTAMIRLAKVANKFVNAMSKEQVAHAKSRLEDQAERKE